MSIPNYTRKFIHYNFEDKSPKLGVTISVENYSSTVQQTSQFYLSFKNRLKAYINLQRPLNMCLSHFIKVSRTNHKVIVY
jgi:hypothetical protein